MSIDQLLGSLEEYLNLKKEIGDGDFEAIKQVRKRIDLSLRDFFQNHFDRALLEERRRSSSNTIKIDPISINSTKISWNDVVKLLDALNNAPTPLTRFDDEELTRHWMNTYRDWFKAKKIISSLSSIDDKLNIDFNDLK